MISLFQKIFGIRQGRNRSGRSVMHISLPAVPCAPELRGDYLAAVQRFLSSEPGHVLLERMRAIESATAVTACQDVMHTSHSAGRAAGFSDARKWILSLSRLSVRDIAETRAEQATPSEGNPSDDSQAHTGEAPLAERLSP